MDTKKENLMEASQVWFRIFTLSRGTKVRVIANTLSPRNKKRNQQIGKIGWISNEVNEGWKYQMLNQSEPLFLSMEDVMYVVDFEPQNPRSIRYAYKASELEVVEESISC